MGDWDRDERERRVREGITTLSAHQGSKPSVCKKVGWG